MTDGLDKIINWVDDFLKKRLSLILLLAGIILLILGPILGVALKAVPVAYLPNQVVPAASQGNMNDAFRYPIILLKDQKLTIEFSANDDNTDVELVILGKGAYENAFGGAPPATGEYFLASHFMDPGLGGAREALQSADINQDGYFYIEFLGDGDGGSDRIWSVPGTYYIVVSVDAGGLDATISITIKIGGPGELLQAIFVISGSIMVGFFLCAVAIYLFDRWGR